MVSWVGLLAGSVVFGAMIVASLVLPRKASPASIIVAVVGMFTSVTSFGTIAATYGTPEAIGGSMVVFIAAITAGYAVAASSLPYLAGSSGTPKVPAAQGDSDAVILIACCEPQRYDPRVVSRRQNLLSESAEITVPMTALPFVYFAEKARYRAIGGHSQGEAVARQLAERVVSVPDAADWQVSLAWCHTPQSLPDAVASVTSAGAARVVLVPLGMPESGRLDEMHALLAPTARQDGVPAVGVAPSVWSDRLLPERMAERIIAATAGAAPSTVGVVLIGEGAPEAWERRYAASAEAETYFNQRVRVLLGDAGIEERHIKTSWLEWQAPDVTESVRHVAALGCTRIVVAPTTVALPTLETTLDLGHAIALARVPKDVLVVALQPWGDDEGFAEALRRCTAAGLARLA